MELFHGDTKSVEVKVSTSTASKQTWKSKILFVGFGTINTRVSKYLHWIKDNTNLEVDTGPNSGEVTSPGYPNSYQNNEYQREDIVVSEGSRIKLSFTVMDIEYDTHCKYDYVQALDTDGGEIGKWCWRTSLPDDVLPDDVYSSGNKMTIIFKSDSSQTEQGFHANWIAVPITSTSTTTTTITTTTTTITITTTTSSTSPTTNTTNATTTTDYNFYLSTIRLN